MKIATVSDLRNNFSKIEIWIPEGEEICIQKRGKTVGYLSSRPQRRTHLSKPDFRARLTDTLHLSTAKYLGAKTFLSFDDKQRPFAQAEGMTLGV